MTEVKISKRLRHTYTGKGNTNPVWAWCIEQYGPPEPNGRRWAWDTMRTFWFHDPKDATLFMLRWL